ncbi:MAG: hypothetical protein P8O69_08315 [Amylibacter sp.]|nr:hypothetical protein [Amylibacter sp.]
MMGKHRLYNLLGKQIKTQKTKTQNELNLMLQKIEKVKQLEGDLAYNIEETIDIGVEQSVHSMKVKSKLREKMIQQKEIVENQIEFLTTEQTHLQKEVVKQDLKTKKIVERLDEIKIADGKNAEMKRLDRDLFFKKK